MEDGTLLQPSRPITILDSLLVGKALTVNTDDEEIWFAETEISGRRYGVLFGAQVANNYKVTFAELGYDAASTVVAVETNTTD